MTREDIETLISDFEKRILSDLDFVQLCKDSPLKAVRELGGTDLGTKLLLSIEEDEDGQVTLYLRPLKNPDDELNDSELENVTGGRKILGIETGWFHISSHKRVKIKVDMPWNCRDKRVRDN